MGLFGGVRLPFRALVVSLRKQFPRIVIEYTAWRALPYTPCPMYLFTIEYGAWRA